MIWQAIGRKFHDEQVGKIGDLGYRVGMHRKFNSIRLTDIKKRYFLQHIYFNLLDANSPHEPCHARSLYRCAEKCTPNKAYLCTNQII